MGQSLALQPAICRCRTQATEPYLCSFTLRPLTLLSHTQEVHDPDGTAIIDRDVDMRKENVLKRTRYLKVNVVFPLLLITLPPLAMAWLWAEKAEEIKKKNYENACLDMSSNTLAQSHPKKVSPPLLSQKVDRPIQHGRLLTSAHKHPSSSARQGPLPPNTCSCTLNLCAWIVGARLSQFISLAQTFGLKFLAHAEALTCYYFYTLVFTRNLRIPADQVRDF